MSQYLLLKSDSEPDDPSVGLTSDQSYEGGVLGGDTYTTTIDTENRLASVRWYDTSTLYNNRSHPTNAAEFWHFFNEERSDVSLGGIDMEWGQALAWDDDEATYPYPKPSYLPADGFSFHFVGEIYAPESGTYQFGIDGDDAVDVYINGERVAYWYGGHGTDGSLSTHSGSIDLSEGWHTIVSRHEEGGGGEAWAVGWNKPSDNSFSVIPNSSYRSPDQSRLDASTGTQTLSTTDTTSSSSVGQTQASSLLDQQGGGFSEVGTAFMESGEVTLSSTIDGGVEESVTFSNDYDNPVVVAYLMTENGGQDIQVRAKDLTENGCTIFAEEPDDQGHNTENVGYIVCERGIHRLENGRIVQAGVKSTDFLYPNDGADSETFHQSFSTQPVVLHLLNSYNNQEFRFSGVDNVTSSGFDVFQDDVTTDSSHVSEDIGWIALESGYYGNLSGNLYEVGTTGTFTETFFSPQFASDPDLVCATQTRDGGSWASGNSIYNSNSFDVENNTGSSNDIGFFVLESDSVVNEQTGGDTQSSTSVRQSSSTSTTLAGALRDAFSMGTLGNSLSDTTAGGLTELFTHVDQPADPTTSSAVNADSSSFDTVQRTALGDALSTVTGDTTTVEAVGAQSINDALTTVLAGAQMTTTTVQDGQSFADVYTQLVAANAPLSPTFGTGTTAVTSLGDAEVSVASPQFDNALVELFAFASPTNTTGNTTIGNGETTTTVTALTENAFAVTLSPTLDIVVAVKKGEVGLESAFADSLSASVGAQTNIKVAKTIANADDLGGVFDTATFADGIASIGELTANESTLTTSTSVDALVVAAALNAFSSSTTQTTGSGTRTQSVGESTLGVGNSLATPDGDVIETVTSIVDADSVSSANPEALKEAAEALLADGVVETETDAAAVVANIVARRQRGTVDTQTSVSGIAETFVTTNRVGRGASSAAGSGGVSPFAPNTIDSGVVASALSVLTAITQSATPLESSLETSATTVGETTGSLFSPQLALLSLLFGSATGSNSTTVETVQRTRLFNTNNSVRIINR